MSFDGGHHGLDGFDDPVRALREAVDGVIGRDPAQQTDAELGVDLVRVRRQMDRLEAAYAVCVLAANRRAVGLADGHVSTTAWIGWKTGQVQTQVRRVHRHGELAELLPETGDAWRAGQITSSAVESIAAARVEGCDEELRAMEPEFLDRAKRGDHKSLRILTQHFAKCARADGSKPEPADGLKLVAVGDRNVLKGEFSSSAAQTIADALNVFTPPPVANDGTSLAVRQAEGLVRICEVALRRGTDAEGARPHVSYLTQERRADDTAAPLTLALFTGVIDPRDRDRILCDATISTITTDPDGNPLSVGRTTSVWPAAIRRALIGRDRHCQWPGCEMPAPWCDAHHFQHWEHGGETKSENGLLLCRRHHTFLHAHPTWAATFNHQQFRVYRPDGTEVHRDPWTGIHFAA